MNLDMLKYIRLRFLKVLSCRYDAVIESDRYVLGLQSRRTRFFVTQRLTHSIACRLLPLSLKFEYDWLRLDELSGWCHIGAHATVMVTAGKFDVIFFIPHHCLKTQEATREVVWLDVRLHEHDFIDKANSPMFERGLIHKGMLGLTPLHVAAIHGHLHLRRCAGR
jgi:hypothetical protein